MNSNLFKRKEQINVYSILIDQCEKAFQASTYLVQFMKTKAPKLGDKIDEIELEADKKRSALINYVENTYITALDRRDLYALSRTLDDITDAITELKDFIVFFDYTPNENSIESMHLAAESISNITDAMGGWNTLDNKDFLALLKTTEFNETDSIRLFWKSIKGIDKNTPTKDVLIEKEFCHNLNGLAAIISKASDRMGDLKIKSIK